MSSNDSWGTIPASAWTSTGIILAMPTYEYKMFHPMAATLEELGRKKWRVEKHFVLVPMGGLVEHKRSSMRLWSV